MILDNEPLWYKRHPHFVRYHPDSKVVGWQIHEHSVAFEHDANWNNREHEGVETETWDANCKRWAEEKKVMASGS